MSAEDPRQPGLYDYTEEEVNACLLQTMNTLAMIVIEHPMLEGRVRYDFMELTWFSEPRIRYENYACLVHNAITDALHHFGKDVMEHPGIRELAVLHYTFLTSTGHAPFLDDATRELLASVKGDAEALKEKECLSLKETPEKLLKRREGDEEPSSKA